MISTDQPPEITSLGYPKPPEITSLEHPQNPEFNLVERPQNPVITPVGCSKSPEITSVGRPQPRRDGLRPPRSPAMVMAILGGAGLLWTARAPAQTAIGYQLGVEQATSTILGEDLETQSFENREDIAVRDTLLRNAGLNPPFNPAGAANLNPAERAGTDVSPLQAVQLTTTVFGGLTIDRPAPVLSQGLILNGRFSQLFPLGVDPDSPQGTVLDENLSIADLNAIYLARVSVARWQFSFEGAYNLRMNGRLLNAPDGSIQGQQSDDPAAVATGAFTTDGITQIVSARLALGLVRRRQDATLFFEYSYTDDGVFSLAPGALGFQGLPGAASTNLGAFASASVHTLTPSFEFRQSLGRQGRWTLNLSSSYSAAIRPEDEVTITGINTEIIPAVFTPPETLVHGAETQIDWRSRLTRRRVGIRGGGFFTQRRATGADGTDLPGSVLGPDALLYSGRVFYADTLPWQLQLDISVGAAQAHLFQAPLGAVVDLEAFENLRTEWEPVGRLELRRRLDPVDMQLSLAREIEVGVLGTSALITEAASLTFVHTARVTSQRRVVTNLGFNFNRSNGLGRDEIPILVGPSTNFNLLAASDNIGFGANAGVIVPLFRERQFTVEGVFNYNFNWIDADPNGLLTPDRAEIDCAAITVSPGANRAQACADLEREVRRLERNATLVPVATHVALLTVRGTWGQGLATARGRASSSAYDPFVRDPRSGSSVFTDRLRSRDRRIFDRGDRPSEPVAPQLEDRATYEARERQERRERTRSGAVMGVGREETPAEDDDARDTPEERPLKAPPPH